MSSRNVMNKIRILAIETSCDETAAAVIGEENGQPVILSNIISSSVDLHSLTGGIVPEVASREQMRFIVPVVAEALNKSVADQFLISNSKFLIKSQNPKSEIQNSIKLLDDITHIAVTAGPGLIGSLLVGFNAAKTLAYAKDLPIIPINHIEGHIYSAGGGVSSKSKVQNSNQIQNLNIKSLDSRHSTAAHGLSEIEDLRGNDSHVSDFPLIVLTVSGGHTMLVLMKDHGKYEIIGAAIDDAVGEAYDKVARLLGLGYPGGPKISEFAQKFRDKFLISNSKFLNKSQKPKSQVSNSTIEFPRPIMKDGTFNFSFSGLKTAVLVLTKKIIAEKSLNNATEINLDTKQEIAAAFEEAVAEVLAFKLGRAVEKYLPKTVIFAGGVSANKYLVEGIKYKVISIDQNIKFLTPTREMSGDNAAMIGIAAYYHIARSDVSAWRNIKVDANMKLI